MTWPDGESSTPAAARARCSRRCAIHRTEGRKPNYHATYDWTAQWTLGGHTAELTFWHRPLHAMTNAFTAAGFRIDVISEPQPLPEARELFPDDYAVATTA